MTEKNYGGASNFGVRENSKANKDKIPNNSNKNTKMNTKTNTITGMDNKNNSNDIEGYSDYIKAGKIASEVVKYAKSFIKPGLPLLEIAEKIDSKILELGGKPAFPVNLSINEIAAHDAPSYNDDRVASGLLKVDIGVHIDGYGADTAFSIDLENSEENQKLIQAAELALNKTIKLIKSNKENSLSEIGKSIESSIKSLGFIPIQNLSGHSIERFDLHAGLTIPNFNNSSNKILENGVYAIEPFSTNGLGSVRDGKPSGIYRIEKTGSVRDSFARQVLDFILEEYSTLPFCSRWIYLKFGSRGLLALKQIEQAGILHQYSQLIERANGKVAQAEHTIIITDKDTIATTALTE